MEIILVGCVHRDPRGKEKLLSFLEKEAPSVITVEVSEYAIAFRKERGPLLRQRLLATLAEMGLSSAAGKGWIRTVFMSISVPYEWEAAEEYGRAKGISVFPIDDSEVSRRKLVLLEEEVLSQKNLELLAAEDAYDIEEDVFQQYALARRYIGDPGFFIFHYDHEERVEMEKRDEKMAGRILEFCQREGKMVHVGGWEHLVDAEGLDNLYKRLKPLSPRRLLLD